MESRDVVGYEGLYRVYDNGEIESLGKSSIPGNKKPFFVKQNKSCGTCSVGLRKDRRTKFYQVHRIIAQAFLDNPYGATIVLHKNNNRFDNRLENLFWKERVNIEKAPEDNLCPKCKTELKRIRETEVITCDKCDYTVFAGDLLSNSSHYIKKVHNPK